MTATLTVIYWRDIPAQVTAKGDAGSARAQLSDRFQKAIDAAAMKAGLVEMDDGDRQGGGAQTSITWKWSRSASTKSSSSPVIAR